MKATRNRITIMLFGMPKRSRNKCALCVLSSLAVFAAAPPGNSLKGYVHAKWTVKDGLAGSDVRNIVQTPDGYLWLATDQGLVRFDGVRFKRFASFPEIPDTVGRGLCVGSDGSLWLGLSKGGVVQVKAGAAKLYPPGNGLLGGQNRIVIQDRSGAIWVGTNAGVSRFQNARWQSFDARDGLPPIRTEAIYQDSAGVIWVNSGDGLFELRPGQKRFIEHVEMRGKVSYISGDATGTAWYADGEFVRPIHGERKLAGSGYGRLLADRRSNLWIGTMTEGLFIEHSTGSRQRERFQVADGLSSSYIESMLEDREGNVWVGTMNGLNCFRPTSFRDEQSGAGPPRGIRAKDDSVFFISNDTLYRMRADGAKEKIPVPEGVVAFAADSGERDPLWIPSGREPMRIATDAGQTPQELLQGRVGKNSPAAHSIQAVAEFAADPAGGLWYVSPSTRHLYRSKNGSLSIVKELENVSIAAVAAAADGHIWAGSSQGAWMFTRDGWQRASGLDTDVYGPQMFYTAKDGSVWALGGLLTRWKDGRVATFEGNLGTGRGFNDMAEDDLGFTWLTAMSGIYRVAATEWEKAVNDRMYRIHARRFDESDGLPSQPSSLAGSLCTRTSDGRLWFALRDGIVSVNPSEIVENRIPPPVVIEGAIADGVELPASRGLGLRPLTRSLQIEYTALSFAAPQKVRFKIRLEGFDKDWVDPGARREVTYTNLEPGSYRFRVIACNNDGVWNEAGESWEFRVLPAFYQTGWFL